MVGGAGWRKLCWWSEKGWELVDDGEDSGMSSWGHQNFYHCSKCEF